MPRRRQTAKVLPVHVFLDAEPPAEIVAAMQRGECRIVTGKRPDPVKLANVLVRVIDAQIAREDAEQAVREAKEKAASVRQHVSG